MSQQPGDGPVQDVTGDHNVLVAYSPGAQVTVIHEGARRLVPLRTAAVSVGATAAPSRLVQGRSRVVPYTARPELLADLQTWLDEPEDFRVRLLGGRGGSGKTRVAVELATWVQERLDWLAGLLIADADGEATDVLIQSPCSKLVIIDYAETRLPQLAGLLPRLVGASSPHQKVRVLLLVRDRPHAGADLRALLTDHSDDLDAVLDDVELEMLDDPTLDERRALFTAAVEAFTARGLPPGTAKPEPPDVLADQIFARPLLVLVAAYLACHDPDVLPQTRDGLLEGLLVHEDRHWEASSRPLALVPLLRERVVAYATLAGASDEDAAIELLGHVPTLADAALERRSAIADWVRALYPGPNYWNPLEPDLFGEYLVVKCWMAKPEVLASALGDRPPEALRQPLELLARAANDRPDFAETVAGVLGSRLVELCTAAVSQAATEDGYDRYFTDTTIAAALERAVRAAPPEPADIAAALDVFPHRPDPVYSPLRITLEFLLIDALRAIDVDHPGLSRALSDVSNELAGQGRHAEALEASEEAVRIYRARPLDIAEERRNFAGMLSNLSNRYKMAGRLDDALDVIEEAVPVVTELAASDPVNESRYLAMVLANYAQCLAELGRSAEALDAAYKSVEIRRSLPPGLFETQDLELAQSLTTLSSAHDQVDQLEASLVVSQEALELYQALAAKNPAAFTVDLGIALNNVGTCFHALGRDQEAIDALTAAISALAPFATANLVAVGGSLAMAMHNISLIAQRDGQAEVAVGYATDSFVICHDVLEAGGAHIGHQAVMSVRRLISALEASGRDRDAAVLRSKAGLEDVDLALD